MVRFPAPVYFLGRWLFGFAGGAMVIGFLLLAFHTAPVHKQIFGVIDYKHAPPFKMGLDHHWLAFFQYTTGQVFASYGSGSRDPFGEYRDAKVFDPRAEWLLQHQEARPYGEGAILGEDGGGPGRGRSRRPPPGGMPPGGPMSRTGPSASSECRRPPRPARHREAEGRGGRAIERSSTRSNRGRVFVPTLSCWTR